MLLVTQLPDLTSETIPPLRAKFSIGMWGVK